MNNGQENIDEFWTWFEEHLAELIGLIDSRSKFLEVALAQLQLIDKNLMFELSNPNEGIREFIITEEGHQGSVFLGRQTDHPRIEVIHNLDKPIENRSVSFVPPSEMVRSLMVLHGRKVWSPS